MGWWRVCGLLPLMVLDLISQSIDGATQEIALVTIMIDHCRAERYSWRLYFYFSVIQPFTLSRTRPRDVASIGTVVAPIHIIRHISIHVSCDFFTSAM